MPLFAAVPRPNTIVRGSSLFAHALLIVLLAGIVSAKERTFELRGSIEPESKAAVTLHGATSPFSASTLTDSRGRFRFRRLLAGPYTLSLYVVGRGEVRQTVVIGPAHADNRGRVPIVIHLRESLIDTDAIRQRHTVSKDELAVPDRANRLYDSAQRKLGRRDIDGAVRDLEQAVEIAPRFSAAWNNLGTIAYQTGQYERAEECFREALKQDPESYPPLVNLGGVLLSLDRPKEAFSYNLHAVLTRPSDALAHSQLGMNYFGLGKLPDAMKSLKRAKELDPAHFSHPQILIAEIYLRWNKESEAIAELKDFIKWHPDSERTPHVQKLLEKLKQ